MEPEDLEPESVLDTPEVSSLIVLMRIYDVLMANLQHSNPAAAGYLYDLHARGGVAMPPVALDPNEIIGDSDE